MNLQNNNTNQITKVYYPPEWTIQKSIWLSYPHNTESWNSDSLLRQIREFMNNLILICLDYQEVNLIFPNAEILEEVTSQWQDTYGNFWDQTEDKKYDLNTLVIPNNDMWIRDYGPFFCYKNDKNLNNKNILEKITQNYNSKYQNYFTESQRAETIGKKSILNFTFNSWGEKFPPWDLDNQVPLEIADDQYLKANSFDMILEGGSVEFNGNGIIMTTKQCLLNPNRNPTISQEEIESQLKSIFNIQHIIWLERGLDGDHTDGHIDDFARFIDTNKILICRDEDTTSTNYQHLSESIEYLKNWRNPETNEYLEVLEIPMPQSQLDNNGEILPASYANFIFLNGAIIMPTFNCTNDTRAMDILQYAFPDYKIIGIDASTLIKEGGGLHCISKQEAL